MDFEGSCVAVYSPHAYPNILEVIKQLQAVDYSDSQISVMGRRATVAGEKSMFLGLLKLFRYKRIKNVFWNHLKDLLKDDITFQITKYDSIVVSGELSRVKLGKNNSENMRNPYVEIDNLLNLVGIPKVSFKFYETVLNNGQSILIIQGNYQELKRAGNLLDLSDNINVSLHLTNRS